MEELLYYLVLKWYNLKEVFEVLYITNSNN